MSTRTVMPHFRYSSTWDAECDQLLSFRSCVMGVWSRISCGRHASCSVLAAVQSTISSLVDTQFRSWRERAVTHRLRKEYDDWPSARFVSCPTCTLTRYTPVTHGRGLHSKTCFSTLVKIPRYGGHTTCTSGLITGAGIPMVGRHFDSGEDSLHRDFTPVFLVHSSTARAPP